MEGDGWPAFDLLFTILAGEARRGLDMRCLKCRGLGRDEGRLLQALGFVQTGDEAGAAAILTDWLPPAAARLAMAPLARLAAAMSAAGLVIPARDFARGPLPTVTVAAHPGLALMQ